MEFGLRQWYKMESKVKKKKKGKLASHFSSKPNKGFWTEAVVNQAKMAVISMFVNSLFIFVNYVISQNVGVGDWVPIFPDQAFGHISPNDFSRRTLDTSFPVNAISKSNSVPKLKQSDLTAVRIDSSENLSNHKLENLKVRAGVSTKNVLPYHPVNFSSLKQGLPYKSDYKINQRGMKEVYLMVNAFLDFIQPGNALPEDFEFTTNPEELLNQLVEKWPSFVHHYKGLASCLVIGILLAVSIPVIGLFICVFRCAGKCGAGEEFYETKRDPCKRGTIGFFFGVFLVLIAFGQVVAFVSNFNLHTGVTTLPDKVQDSRDDVAMFLSNTKEEVNTLMVQNYNELEQALEESLDDCGNLVRNELARISKAVAVDQLNGIVDTVNGITVDLVGISKETQELSKNAEVLKEDLRTIRSEIRSLLDKCKGRVDACSDFERKFNNLAVVDLDQQFEKLPEINEVARKLSDFLNSSIKQEILKGVTSLNAISTQVDEAIKSFIDEHVKIQIKRSGEMLNKTAEDIVSLLDKAIEIVYGPQVNGTLRISRDLINDYEPFRFYGDLVVCGVVLSIFIILALGLMCGCCGSKPTIRHDGCGTRAAGGSWIKFGVVQIFMLFVLLMSLVVVHFVVGSISEKLVCDSQNGSQSTYHKSMVMETLDQVIDFDKYYPEEARPTGVHISSVLSECNKNATIYKALRLYKVHNLSVLQSLPNQLGIPELVNKLISDVQIPEDSFKIITEEAKRKFEKLAQSELSKSNYSNYSHLLENQITAINLLVFAEELRRTAEEVSSFDESVEKTLIRFADKLEGHQKNTVRFMEDSAKSLKIIAARIEENIKFNETSLEEAVRKLVSLAEDAEEELQQNGSFMLQEVAHEFGRDFERLIQDYANRVGNYSEKEIGRCGPLNHAAAVPVEALCRGIIDPLNGFWAAVGWALVWFIICAFVSLPLIDLYKKTEDYAPANTQPVGLSPYNMPNAYNYEGDYPEFPPHVGNKSLSAVNSDSARTRSSIVSPSSTRNGRTEGSPTKAWGGASPPRYTPGTVVSQGASATQEYERPPPYYYPGPANLPS
ncbi:prominin-like protein isoform X4 [Artemia franciscana]